MFYNQTNPSNGEYSTQMSDGQRRNLSLIIILKLIVVYFCIYLVKISQRTTSFH